MKKHKNIYLSLGSYVVAIVVYFCLLYVPDISPTAVYMPTLILIFIGMFYGLRSIKAKESSWAGHLMVVIGAIIIASPTILFILAANGII